MKNHFTFEPLHHFENEIDLEEDLETTVNNNFEEDAEYDDNDDDLYDLSLYCNNSDRWTQPTMYQPQSHTPEYYLEKAAKAYDNFKYQKCLDYIDDYESK